jgi:predicted nucleic acid-binding protein
MSVPVVVPDASVLLKWVVPSRDERDADRALLLRSAIADEHVRALVPALWLYEVGNTAARRFPAHAQQWLSAMVKFGLQEAQPSERWLATVLDLTSRYDTTFYDAAYHATALVHGGVLVTADSRSIKLAQKQGAIISLTDWQPPEPRAKRRSR